MSYHLKLIRSLRELSFNSADVITHQHLKNQIDDLIFDLLISVVEDLVSPLENPRASIDEMYDCLKYIERQNSDVLSLMSQRAIQEEFEAIISWVEEQVEKKYE